MIRKTGHCRAGLRRRVGADTPGRSTRRALRRCLHVGRVEGQADEGEAADEVADHGRNIRKQVREAMSLRQMRFRLHDGNDDAVLYDG